MVGKLTLHGSVKTPLQRFVASRATLMIIPAVKDEAVDTAMPRYPISGKGGIPKTSDEVAHDVDQGHEEHGEQGLLHVACRAEDGIDDDEKVVRPEGEGKDAQEILRHNADLPGHAGQGHDLAALEDRGGGDEDGHGNPENKRLPGDLDGTSGIRGPDGTRHHGNGPDTDGVCDNDDDEEELGDKPDGRLDVRADEPCHVKIGQAHEEIEDHDEKGGPGQMPDVFPEAALRQLRWMMLADGLSLHGIIYPGPT